MNLKSLIDAHVATSIAYHCIRTKLDKARLQLKLYGMNEKQLESAAELTKAFENIMARDSATYNAAFAEFDVHYGGGHAEFSELLDDVLSDSKKFLKAFSKCNRARSVLNAAYGEDSDDEE